MAITRIKENKKWGLMLNSTTLISPCIYDEIGGFYKNGLAKIRKNKLFGLINKDGKEVAPCIYKDIYQDTYPFLVKKGKTYGFINEQGEEIIPAKYNYAHRFQEGLALVQEEKQWCFIDETGKKVIQLTDFDRAESFKNDLAVLIKVRGDFKKGYIDRTGKEVIPCSYDDAHSFSEGLAKVKQNDLWGYIDKTGKEIIPFHHQEKSHYFEGGSFINGFARIKKEGKWGFIDTTGTEVIPCIYDDVRFLINQVACVQKDEKWGFIDTTGQEVIPFIYDKIDFFRNGLAWVKKDSKYGFIDRTGNEVIPCIYDAAYGYFYNNIEMVVKDGKWGVINTLGKELIPIIYKETVIYQLKEYYEDNDNTFPILDILTKLQSTDKKVQTFGKDLLKTVNHLIDTDQAEGISIDTDTMLSIAITWATSADMGQRISSAHLIRTLCLNIKKNKTPLITISYKTYQAFQKALIKTPITLEDYFEIQIPNGRFVHLFYPFTTDGLDYKAFVDRDYSIKFLDLNNTLLTKIPKGTDKGLEKDFKDLSKLYTQVHTMASQQFEIHKKQGKTWAKTDWENLFLKHPFYFNLALKYQWKTDTNEIFNVQDDQCLINANGDEIQLKGNSIISLI